MKIELSFRAREKIKFSQSIRNWTNMTFEILMVFIFFFLFFSCFVSVREGKKFFLKFHAFWYFLFWKFFFRNCTGMRWRRSETLHVKASCNIKWWILFSLTLEQSSQDVNRMKGTRNGLKIGWKALVRFLKWVEFADLWLQKGFLDLIKDTWRSMSSSFSPDKYLCGHQNNFFNQIKFGIALQNESKRGELKASTIQINH